MLLELSREAGLNPRRKAATYGGEYCSSCPKCGGDDRFLIWPQKQMKNVQGAYWCRVCDIRGDTIQFCVDVLGLNYPAAFKKCQVKGDRSQFKPMGTVFYESLSDLKANPTWKKEMGALVDRAHQAIDSHASVLAMLSKRGIPYEAVKLYKIGYLPNVTLYKKSDLHLSLLNEGKDQVWIPPGITIPTLEKGKVLRLKVRRSEWKPNDTIQKYIAISGSLGGLNIIGERGKDIVAVVESELDAYAVHWIMKEKGLVIAVGSNLKHPDSFTHSFVKKAKRLLIIHDNDEGGEGMLKKWSGLYAHAIGCPVPKGKDVGEAFEEGYDVKKWLNSLS